MVEMGKTQDQIQSDTSLEKTALIIQILGLLKLHSTAFGMFFTPRMVTPFDLNHCYISLLNG